MSVQYNHKIFTMFVTRVVPAYNPSDTKGHRRRAQNGCQVCERTQSMIRYMHLALATPNI